jgi:SAM-dependent methyltransferase
MPEYPHDFSQLLHQLRTNELALSERVIGTMISVGCNGSYYFDWIHANLGAPTKHLGLEFYLPKPVALPQNVEWIQNTAGNMSAVDDQCADLVFAGQTVEHLWADEFSGFILESARVLKSGGRLIIDSPNEEITEALVWNHPEHTIELRPADIIALLNHAGFDIVKSIGHWLCRDPSNQELIALRPDDADANWTVERRISLGRSDPSRCFSWWIEARRSERLPNASAVWRGVAEMWQTYYRRRVRRMMQSQSTERFLRSGRQWAIGPAGWNGALVFGPRCPLRPGQYLICFRTDPYNFGVSPGHVEVFESDLDQGLGKILATRPLPVASADGVITLEITLGETKFGLEFRLWFNCVYPLSAEVGVDIFRSQ